jgi:hypothetical protein
MFNNESNINKKEKYGFKRNLIGRERPNLFVNVNGRKQIIKQESFISSSQDNSFMSPVSSKIDAYMTINVYIISNIQGGGTLKYKNDIKAKYTHVNFVEVSNKKMLDSINLNVNDVLFVQQLLFSDLDPRDILNIKYKYGSKIIISIHDFCWITDALNNNPTHPYYHWSYLVPYITIHRDIIELF